MKSLLPFAFAGLAMLLWVLVVFSQGFARLMRDRPFGARVRRLLSVQGLKDTHYIMVAVLVGLIALAPAGPRVAYQAWERSQHGASPVEGICGCRCGLVETYHPMARMWQLSGPLAKSAAEVAAREGGDANSVAAGVMDAFAAAAPAGELFGARERVLLREVEMSDEKAATERNHGTLAMAGALKKYRREAGEKSDEVAEAERATWQRLITRLGSQVHSAYCAVRMEAVDNRTGEVVTLADVPDVSRHGGLSGQTRFAAWYSSDYAEQRWALLAAAAARDAKAVEAAAAEMAEHEVSHLEEAKSWLERVCPENAEPEPCFGVLDHFTNELTGVSYAELEHAEAAAESVGELPSAWSIFVDTFVFSLLVYNLLSALNLMPWLSEVFGDEDEAKPAKDGAADETATEPDGEPKDQEEKEASPEQKKND